MVLWSGAVTVTARPLPFTPDTAFLLISGAHTPGSTVPGVDVVGEWCADLTRRGYSGVRTGAVGPDIAESLRHNGFRVVQDLTLLSADLTGPLSDAAHDRSVRPVLGRLHGGRAVVRGVLRVDREAFGDRWALDSISMVEAAKATARSRMFVSGAGGDTDGFVLVGRTDRSGFIQRLAVDPARQRTGVGLRLMHAAHRWLRSHRCTTALVNTETDNLAALRLYQRFGYAELPYGLQVLERPLTHAAEVS
jgi:ribosomal protein S18 acetylase RimI-like enzyme